MTNRAVETILNRWGLTEEEKTQLLGAPYGAIYRRRQTDIISIALLLKDLSATPDLWFKKPNDYFGGVSALQYCLLHKDGLHIVKEQLTNHFK